MIQMINEFRHISVSALRNLAVFHIENFMDTTIFNGKTARSYHSMEKTRNNESNLVSHIGLHYNPL